MKCGFIALLSMCMSTACKPRDASSDGAADGNSESSVSSVSQGGCYGFTFAKIAESKNVIDRLLMLDPDNESSFFTSSSSIVWLQADSTKYNTGEAKKNQIALKILAQLKSWNKSDRKSGKISQMTITERPEFLNLSSLRVTEIRYFQPGLSENAAWLKSRILELGHTSNVKLNDVSQMPDCQHLKNELRGLKSIEIWLK
ncbi:MAG: hypothetical protein RL189_522 [Pseudomonadota bacterium]